MEGSNDWGYGYKTQHSYPRSRLVTWRRSEVKFSRNVGRRNNKKPTKMRTKSPQWIRINSQISLQVILFLSKLEIICLHTCIAIASSKLDGFNYCNVTQTLLSNIYHLFAHSQVIFKYFLSTLNILFSTINSFVHIQMVSCIAM